VLESNDEAKLRNMSSPQKSEESYKKRHRGRSTRKVRFAQRGKRQSPCGLIPAKKKQGGKQDGHEGTMDGVFVEKDCEEGKELASYW